MIVLPFFRKQEVLGPPACYPKGGRDYARSSRARAPITVRPTAEVFRAGQRATQLLQVQISSAISGVEPATGCQGVHLQGLPHLRLWGGWPSGAGGGGARLYLGHPTGKHERQSSNKINLRTKNQLVDISVVDTDLNPNWIPFQDLCGSGSTKVLKRKNIG